MTESGDDARLQINDRIQVTIKGSDEEVPTTYYSRVEDLKGQDYVIGWPTSRGIRAPVREDTVLLVSYITGRSVYCIESAILERVRQPVPLLRVRPLAPPRSIQRREYVRVPALVDIELTPQVVTMGADGQPVGPVDIRARTHNLSGGGFAVHHPQPIRIDTLFDVKLKLPGTSDPIALAAKVVRCELGEDPTKERYYDVGFAFVHVVESLRRKIVSYVFRVQQSSLMRD